jgi:threonine/homoserine/homoserine lactone efflux protein
MTIELYLIYVIACAVITLVPGPTVTVIFANSLAHGTRAGLLNVTGTQAGLGVMMAILVVGLNSIIAAMSWLFDWLRVAGAIYLVYLAWKLLRSPRQRLLPRRWWRVVGAQKIGTDPIFLI